jgi:hypothetical protein
MNDIWMVDELKINDSGYDNGLLLCSYMSILRFFDVFATVTNRLYS